VNSLPASADGSLPLAFHEVDRERWSDLERLFENRGGPKHCWCMVWRATPAEARQRDGASRKAALKQRIDSGVPVGILGYIGGEAIAWCSIAPRSTYRRLGGGDLADSPEAIWSIACFFVVRCLRLQGVATRLVEAAIDHARRKGAAIIEAYPVEADSPSYRFMGFVSMFEALGFREVGLAGRRRHIMRLRLGNQPERPDAAGA
jgi:GNAT superfamily N-acetyltransferase